LLRHPGCWLTIQAEKFGLEDHIDPKQFIRINREQIINLKYIKEITEWSSNRLKITLTTGEDVEVSRRQVHEIKDLYRI
jgi:two-component system LytT family response regulator